MTYCHGGGQHDLTSACLAAQLWLFIVHQGHCESPHIEIGLRRACGTAQLVKSLPLQQSVRRAGTISGAAREHLSELSCICVVPQGA